MNVKIGAVLMSAIVSVSASAGTEKKVFVEKLDKLKFNGVERLEQDLDENSSNLLQTDTRAYQKILISNSEQTGILVTPEADSRIPDGVPRESLLYVFKDKKFLADSGKFSTDDPVEIRNDEVNVYNYVRNNPLRYVDPDGLSAQDVKRIQQYVDRSVSQMVASGERRPGAGWFGGAANNISRSSWALGGPGKKYLGCGEQAQTTVSGLQSMSFDDQWEFEVDQYGGFHQVGVAYSSNPNDPIVIVDPWRNSSLTIPRE